MNRLTIIFTVLTAFTVQAKVHLVKIGYGNQYIHPSVSEIKIGDTLRFVNYGSRNTTTSISVPYGAKSWDYSFKSYKSSFDVSPNVAGVYEFYSETHSQIKAKIIVKSIEDESALPFVIQNTKNDYFDFYIGQNISEEVNVKVYNLLGKQIFEKRMVLKKGRGQFNSKFLLKGIYFLKIYHDYQQVFFYKFIKE